MSTLRIAWYNLENLFEPGQHPELKESWTQNRYEKKVRNVASVVAALHSGYGPDMLGICEVASKEVIEDILAEIPNGAEYGIVHADSPDPRRIDVSFIYRQTALELEEARAYNIRKRWPTRDIMHVRFQASNGSKLHVVGTHWPSRTAGQYETEPFRILVAENCTWIVGELYKKDPGVNILVMGDFNDEPFNRSVQEYLFGIHNRQRVAKRRGGARSRPYLYNLMWCLLDDPMPGTFYWGDNPAGWNMLDQMMVSKGLLTGSQNLKINEDTIAIFRPDWIRDGSKPKPFRKRKNGWILGYSDHFPITATIEML